MRHVTNRYLRDGRCSLAALLKRGKIRKLRPDRIISLDEAGETKHIPEFLREGHLLGLNDRRGLTLALAVLQKRDNSILTLRSPFRGEINEMESVVVGPYHLDADGNTTLIRS